MIFTKQSLDLSYKLGDIEIREVSNKETFNKFKQVPIKIYEGNPYWMPPLPGYDDALFSDRYPFWNYAEAHLLLAERNGHNVGRAVVYIDHNLNKIENSRYGFFGLFEAINDYDVFKALYNACRDWLSTQNIKTLIGPIDLTIDNPAGFLQNAYDIEQRAFTGYHLPYYKRLTEQYGFEKFKDEYGYLIDLTKPIPDRIMETVKRIENDPSISISYVMAGNFDKNVREWAELTLEAFRELWGFSRNSVEELEYLMHDLKILLDRELFFMIKKDGEAIGYRLMLPDYGQIMRKIGPNFSAFDYIRFLFYKRHITRGKSMGMAIKKEHRGKGYGTYMNYVALKTMRERGYTDVDYGLIHEDNIPSQKSAEKWGGVRYKTWRVYQIDV